MPMAANKSLKARNQAGRPQVAGSACVAAMLLLLVPLLTLEADARGGGGGFGGHGGGFGGHVGVAGRGGGIGFAGRGAGFGGARSFGVTRIGGTSFGNRSLGLARRRADRRNPLRGPSHCRPQFGRSLAERRARRHGAGTVR